VFLVQGHEGVDVLLTILVIVAQFLPLLHVVESWLVNEFEENNGQNSTSIGKDKEDPTS